MQHISGTCKQARQTRHSSYARDMDPGTGYRSLRGPRGTLHILFVDLKYLRPLWNLMGPRSVPVPAHNVVAAAVPARPLAEQMAGTPLYTVIGVYFA